MQVNLRFEDERRGENWILRGKSIRGRGRRKVKGKAKAGFLS